MPDQGNSERHAQSYRRSRLRLLLFFVVGLTILSFFKFPDGSTTKTETSLFSVPSRLPQFLALEDRIQKAFAKNDYLGAEDLVRKQLQAIPQSKNARYNLACALAQLGREEKALQALRESVEVGFNDSEHMANDEDLEPLREREEFKAILADAGKREGQLVSSVRARSGRAIVGVDNTQWVQETQSLNCYIDPPEIPNSRCTSGSAEVLKRVRAWYADGTAAGNHGDLYDNRDDGHSLLNTSEFPQLTSTVYSDSAKNANQHNGLQRWIQFNRPTIGNASVATKPHLSSLVRVAYSRSSRRRPTDDIFFLYRQFTTNHLYVYPSANDFRPYKTFQSRTGDQFCANTPYVIVSKGMSYRDKPFLFAMASTLAAFQPATKKKLIETGMIAPTLQMIMRSTYKVDNDSYLAGTRHPVVFDGDKLDASAMADMAHSMGAEEIPPRVFITVKSESKFVNGVDYFHNLASEEIFTTPSAIARICRSTAFEREMIVSANESEDFNQRGIRWHWVVLQGNKDRIEMTPVDGASSTMRIKIKYHEKMAVEGVEGMKSNRVDIGVFVFNGKYYSAPGIISFYFPENELRSYNEDGKLRSIVYLPPKMGRSIDTDLQSVKSWRDDIIYSKDGQRFGWVRDSYDYYFRNGTQILRERSFKLPDGRRIQADSNQFLGKVLQYRLNTTKGQLEGKPIAIRRVPLPRG